MHLLRFAIRRVRQIIALLVLMIVISILFIQLDISLRRTAFVSGWTIMGMTLLLTLYNLRKRLTFIPIFGSSRAWMQIHIYFGFLSTLIFFFHIGIKVPDGQFEFLLGSLFLFVSASGMYGLYITRVVPAKLTAIREEVVFEEIPQLRFNLQKSAEALVQNCAEQAPSLAELYLTKLNRFFTNPRGILYFAFPNGRTKRTLLSELTNVDRYLDDDAKSSSRELRDLVNRKDDLDYHHAMQGRLKLWLFVHIGTTYSMLICSFLHVALVYAFHGGLR